MGATPRQIAAWRCRVGPLSADRWLAIEFRTWRNSRWRKVHTDTVRPINGGLGILLDDIVYCSLQRPSRPGAPTAYAISKVRMTA